MPQDFKWGSFLSKMEPGRKSYPWGPLRVFIDTLYSYQVPGPEVHPPHQSCHQDWSEDRNKVTITDTSKAGSNHRYWTIFP